jgi:hypothetical protein
MSTAAESGMADLDRQRAVDREAMAAAFREGRARTAERRELELQTVLASITTRVRRSPEETAARLADGGAHVHFGGREGGVRRPSCGAVYQLVAQNELREAA